MHYPLIIQQDDNTFMVSFPDIPEALTCGDTYEETKTEALDALITAFEFYFEDQQPIPLPSSINNKNNDFVTLPALVRDKVLFFNKKVQQTKINASKNKHLSIDIF